MLELLDPLDESAHGLGPAREIDADRPRPVEDVARPHLVGHQDARLVADLRRVDVLVGPAGPLDGADVDARLVREGAAADERLVAVRCAVRHFADVARRGGETRQGSRRQTAQPELQLEVGDHGAEIGVAAALPVAVDRPLHVPGARRHRRQAVRRGQLAVVVGVDADRQGAETGARHRHRRPYLVRQRPAVGVAQHDAIGAGLRRGQEGQESVLGTGAVAVEEVLGVVDHLAAGLLQEPHAVGDHRQVLLELRAQRLAHVVVPGLAENRHPRRAGRQEGQQALVRRGARAHATRASEGYQTRGGERLARRPVEELEVLRIGAGPPAFDERHAQPVERAQDLQLVLDRVGDLLRLRSVPQRRVVDLHRPGHGVPVAPVVFGHGGRDRLQDLRHGRATACGADRVRARSRRTPVAGGR